MKSEIYWHEYQFLTKQAAYMDSVLSGGTFVKALGISLVFGGIALFAVAIVQRARQAVIPISRPFVAPTAVVKTRRKSNPSPKPPAKPNPTDSLTNAQALHRAEPQYTEEARRANYEGIVHVSVTINDDGSVGDIEILDSPGLGLDENILAAVREWKFKPATRGGVAITQKGTIAITFKRM